MVLADSGDGDGQGGELLEFEREHSTRRVEGRVKWFCLEFQALKRNQADRRNNSSDGLPGSLAPFPIGPRCTWQLQTKPPPHSAGQSLLALRTCELVFGLTL